jgi:membrane protease YdiL (CAAX protease family)
MRASPRVAVADATVAPHLARRRQRSSLAAGELALVVSVFIAGSYHLVPLSKTPFLFIIGWLSLRLRGLRWRDVGLVRPDNWLRMLAIGAAAGMAMELFALFVSEPMFARLAGRHPDLSDFRPLVGNLRLLLIVVVPVWLGSALEELVYRGYFMNRVAGLGRFTPAAWLASLVLVSAFFGFAHEESQGITGMLQEGFAGLLLGLLYLASGRTLTVPIVAHGASNTLAFVLIYFNRYPGV